MRVAIIHPWLPQYRVQFFQRLVSEAAQVGVEIRIFYGDTPPEWRRRGDSGLPDGFTKLPTAFMSFKGRSLNRKALGPIFASGPYDLIVVEQAVRNLETYELLARREPVAFWGHGRTFTKAVRPQQDKFKQWLVRRGRWFFAYTEGGAQAMALAGMDPDRMTVVQNSVDTSSLRNDISSLSPGDLQRFRAEYDLRGKTALFIGGLDSSKRLPFLLEAAERVAKKDPDFRLLMVGAGDDQALVEHHAERSLNVRYLGPLFGREKALAIAASEVMAMPGRVGLVAVDSFVGQSPIVTTYWPWHSVEFEYLTPDVNAVITENSVEAYSAGLLKTLKDNTLLSELYHGCAEAGERYTLEAMVRNFLHGVLDALERVK